MKKIKCGDANPNGNIAMFFKGGCGKEIDIAEAYRCAGCGGYFHRDCLFEHFELEAGHDYSRNALRQIKDLIENAKIIGDKDGKNLNLAFIGKILKLAKEGLERKPVKKSFGFPFNEKPKPIKEGLL